MIKNKLDYRLVNITIIGIILFLMYQTSNLWIGLLDKVLIIFGPFVVAFAIAYALNPFVVMLEKKKLSHKLSVSIVSITLMLSIILIAVLVLPTLFTQTISFLNSIDTFIQEMVSDYNIDLGNLGVFLDSSIEEFSKSIGTYVTEGAMKTISMSLGFLTNMVIVLAVAIYFLFDFNSIRNFIKLFLIKRSQRLFNYVKLLDNEITNYFKGLVKITIIAYFEYTIAFLIIGHPNALLIGF
jgi:predicted PurR-regulated permease PerM